jgi:hypothetical protein
VADLLFKPQTSCEEYKRLQNTYDNKNKVMSAIKVWHKRVTGPCNHSSLDTSGHHEELLEVEQPSICLCVVYQEIVDIQKAIRHENLLDKEKIQNASQCLAPNPKPLPQTFDAIHAIL